MILVELPLKRRVKSFCHSPSVLFWGFFPPLIVPVLTWMVCWCRFQLCSVVISSSVPSLSPSDSASPQPPARVGSPWRGRGDESPTHTSCAGATRRRHNPLIYSLSSGKTNGIIVKQENRHLIALMLYCVSCFRK